MNMTEEMAMQYQRGYIDGFKQGKETFEPKTGHCNTCRWNDEDLLYNPQCENCCRNYHDNYESVNGGDER